MTLTNNNHFHSQADDCILNEISVLASLPAHLNIIRFAIIIITVVVIVIVIVIITVVILAIAIIISINISNNIFRLVGCNREEKLVR